MSLLLLFSIFFLLYLLFIWKASYVYPILYLFVFVYFVQYIFSVHLIYEVYPVLRKQMPIREDQLFNYAIPALLCLFGGVFIFNKDVRVKEVLKNVDVRNAVLLGHLLLSISYFFDLLGFLNVPGVKSIISFTYYLKYIGVMSYLFSPKKINYALIAFVYLGLFFEAFRGGVFIDLFVWSAYMFLLVSIKFNFSVLLRASFIFIALPIIVVVQSVKQEYREQTWSGKRERGVEVFQDLAEKKQEKENDPYAKSKGVVRTVGRLNQGWHLGLVLRWVPRNQPFSGGDDMLGDIKGTILPRIFFPEKKEIGSQDKFYKYTGHKLSKITAMTIGVLGDFYINFGRTGSFIGLFIFGAVIARLLYFFMRKHVLTDPINIIWIPFLFSYLVRANNDFYVVINSFVKGYLIFLFITFLRKQLWPAPVVRNLSQ